MSAPTVFDPQTLPEGALAALHVHQAALARAASAPFEQGSTALSVRIGPGEAIDVDLPPALARVVAAALAEVADGHAVEIRTVGEELSTQEAADLLGVSRPFLVGLLDAEEIPSWKVGSHRRVLRTDVLAHRARMRATATDALGELSDQAQEFGLYDMEPRMSGADGPLAEDSSAA